MDDLFDQGLARLKVCYYFFSLFFSFQKGTLHYQQIYSIYSLLVHFYSWHNRSWKYTVSTFLQCRLLGPCKPLHMEILKSLQSLSFTKWDNTVKVHALLEYTGTLFSLWRPQSQEIGKINRCAFFSIQKWEDHKQM